MGLFIKNHGNYGEGSIGPRYTNNQGTDYVSGTITSGISIFTTLMQKIGDGKGSDGNGTDGVDSNGKVSKEAQKQIDELNTKIDTKLKEANAADIADLSSKITACRNEQQKIEAGIDSIKTDMKVSQSVIDNYPEALKNLKDSLKGQTDPKIQAQINASIKQLDTEKSKAEANIKELNEKLKAEEDKLKAEKAKEIELTTLKGEVENYQHRVDELKSKLPKEIDYDVKQESSDIANFSDALKKFNNSPSQNTADAVITAYKSGKVDNKTVAKAYEMLEKQYPQFFKKSQK